MRSIKDESGNAVIESVFVVTVAIISICVLIVFGFLFYQSALLQVIADDTSSKLSRTYAYDCRDPEVGYISQDSLVDRSLADYFYIFAMPSRDNSSYQVSSTDHSSNRRTNECIEAAWYAGSALNRYRFMAASANSTDVRARVYNSEMLPFQAEIEVVVTEKYSMPLLSFFGVNDNLITYQATSRAVCTDMLAYQGQLSFIGDMEEYLTDEMGISDTEEALNKFVECASTALDVAKKLTGAGEDSDD